MKMTNMQKQKTHENMLIVFFLDAREEELESDESENQIEDIENEEEFERKRKKAKKKPNMKRKKRCADCMTDHNEFLGH